MDARALRELELLAVARLYGRGAPARRPVEADWSGLRVQVAEPRARRGAPAAALSPWLFVAGAGEGEPFEGTAGKLFDAMLAAIGRGRGPEIDADGAIVRVRPALVVALGQAAAARLLGSDGTLASLRGQLHRCQDVPAVATFHPGELLQSPLDKAKAWEDLVFARRSLAEP